MENQNICKKTGKICYSSKEAGNVIRRLKFSKGGVKNKKIPKRQYYCCWCGTYHLTHYKNIKNKGGQYAK